MGFTRRSIDILVIAALAGLYQFPAHADSNPARFTGVKSWSGTIKIAITGSGSFTTPNCSTTTFKENDTSTFSLNLGNIQSAGPSATWTAIRTGADISIDIEDTYSNPQCTGKATETWIGSQSPTFNLTPNQQGIAGIFGGLNVNVADQSYLLLLPGVLNQLQPWCFCALVTHTQSGPFGNTSDQVDVQYTDGLSITESLPANGLVISGSITRTYVGPFSIPGAIETETITYELHPADCGPIPVVPLGQGAQPWGPEHYDFSTKKPPTIARWGCAMTSMTMAMTAAGFTGNSFVNPDPGSVNSFMQQKAGDFIGDRVNWDPAVRDLSLGNLKFNSLTNLDSGQDPIDAGLQVNQQLCAEPPRPVIVGVKECIGTDGTPKFPCHFVLINGLHSGRYTIVDPANGSPRDLVSVYGTRFTTRGTVSDPPGDLSALDLAIDHNATLMVTGPDGTQTGLNPGTGNILQNIPNSAYYIDQYQDAQTLDLTGPVEVTESAHILNIFQPNPGMYRIVVSGSGTGPYKLSVRPFAQDGSAQQPINLVGLAEVGSLATYFVEYSPLAGANSTVVAIPGDRNGDGLVNCADLEIVKASFGKSLGQPGFDPRADVNEDGAVNVLDLAMVARQLPAGTSCH